MYLYVFIRYLPPALDGGGGLAYNKIIPERSRQRPLLLTGLTLIGGLPHKKIKDFH